MKIYKFLRLFFVPKCWHKWEEKDSYSIQYKGEGYFAFGFDRFSTKFIVCKCSKCGAWKKFKV